MAILTGKIWRSQKDEDIIMGTPIFHIDGKHVNVYKYNSKWEYSGKHFLFKGRESTMLICNIDQHGDIEGEIHENMIGNDRYLIW